MSNFHSKWKQFLQEAQQDAKVLRSLNIKAMQKEVPQGPEEQPREYFARLQGMEADPEYANPIFPQGLVTWLESLPDNHFPRDGRKRFAKWLGNAVYTHETETMNNINSVDNPEELQIHNNDIRYISDYLNGSQEFPEDLWEKSLNGMYDLAVQWHDTLKFKEDPTGDYEHKDVVYKFDNGYTIVDVNTENDLDVEGEKMGHCVGSYCDNVASGETTIYSLRDAKNEPHATIEVAPTLPLGRTRSRGRVDQIKGKGNAAPVDKYRPMIKQWLQTTDFTYENSPDYLNMLPDEEIKEKLFAGDLGKDAEQNLARNTGDSEIIKFFLSQLLAAGEGGGTDITRVTKLDSESIAGYLLRNDNLTEDHRLSFVKINFQLRRPVLGVRTAMLIGARGITPNQNFDHKSLSSRIWADLGEELTRGYSDEKLYCLQALMEVDDGPPSIKEEIINHLLSEEYIEGAVRQNRNVLEYQQQPYGSILQGYLFQKSPSPEQVKRLYIIQRDERFIKVMGSFGRINGYIASSRGMTDELADEIIEDVKAEKIYAFMSRNWMDMIMNPQLSDSKKIALLNIGGDDIKTPRSIVSLTGKYNSIEGKGLKWTMSGRSYSRQLYNAAREKKFSKKQ